MNNKIFMLLAIIAIGVGVSLDMSSTIIGLEMGFHETGNALFWLEFLSLSGIAVFYVTVKRRLFCVFPIALSFVAFINNVLLMVL